MTNRPNMTQSVANYIRHRDPAIERETAKSAAHHAISEIIEILNRWGEHQAAAILKENRFK